MTDEIPSDSARLEKYSEPEPGLDGIGHPFISSASIHEETGVSKLKDLWQRKAESHLKDQERNPFHGGMTVSRLKVPRRGDPEYGRPPAGSLSAQRAARADDWVTNEIESLVSIMRTMGTLNADGHISVPFGKLFDRYADISNTLAGILMRAKKRHRISYPGL